MSFPFERKTWEFVQARCNEFKIGIRFEIVSLEVKIMIFRFRFIFFGMFTIYLLFGGFFGCLKSTFGFFFLLSYLPLTLGLRFLELFA